MSSKLKAQYDSQAKLPLWHRLGVILSLAGAWGTGVVVLWARYFGRRDGPFGLQNHWIEFPARAAHGFVVLLFLLALGSLVPLHIGAGWRTGSRRNSALALVVPAILLIVTGWGIYYAGGETLRQGLSWTHSALGVSLLPLLFLHSRQKPF